MKKDPRSWPVFYTIAKTEKPEEKSSLQQDSNLCLPKTSGVLQPTELLFVPAKEYYHIFDEMNFADENQSMQRSPQVRCNFTTAPAKISFVLDFHLQVKIKLIFKKIGSKYKTRYRKNFWNHVRGKIRWCIRESGKITFLYVFGATDSERKRGTTNYRKKNRQKKRKPASIHLSWEKARKVA